MYCSQIATVAVPRCDPHVAMQAKVPNIDVVGKLASTSKLLA